MTTMLRACLLMAVLAVGGLTLGGCTSYSAPRMSVDSVRATERTSDGAAMVFVLAAENDNDVALPLRTVEYTVTLNGQQVFTGTRSAEATLRRKGVQQITLPAVITADEAGALATGMARYRLSGRVYYVTPGQLAEILFDSGVRTPSAEFGFDGDIDLGGGQAASAAD